MSSVKRATVTAACIALCAVLPLAFHAVGLGAAFSPIHLPVLLCGLLCGGAYGAFCGAAGPLLSCLVSGMPAAVQLIYMIPETLTYGLFAGFLFQRIRTGSLTADLYLSLVPAMILGRVVGGCAHAIFFLATDRAYSVALWAAAYLTGSLPAIAVQLILIPALLIVLIKAGVVPDRRQKHE